MDNQLSLDLWKEQYSSEFLFLNNKEIIDQILNIHSQFLLIGPNKSGKKHLSFFLLKTYNIEFYVLNLMSDIEILNLFEKMRIINKKCIWIANDISKFCKDIQSRLSYLFLLKIKDLNEESFVKYFKYRLKRIGVEMDISCFNYSLFNLSHDYYVIDEFIKYISSQPIINLKIIRKFIRKD